MFNLIGNQNGDTKKNKKPINASFKLGRNSLKLKQSASGSFTIGDTTQIGIDDYDASNLDFEKFRNAYPWKGVYLPENVDRSLENVRRLFKIYFKLIFLFFFQIFSLVIRHFVLTWYT